MGLEWLLPAVGANENHGFFSENAIVEPFVSVEFFEGQNGIPIVEQELAESAHVLGTKIPILGTVSHGETSRHMALHHFGHANGAKENGRSVGVVERLHEVIFEVTLDFNEGSALGFDSLH